MNLTVGPSPTRHSPTRHSPARRTTARARGFQGLRGTLAGTVSAGGALAAHLLAGGAVEPVPGLVVASVAIPFAVRATPRHEIGAARLAGLAVLAQALGHLSLMMAPERAHGAGPHAHGDGTGAPSLTVAMLGAHALVAVATVAVAGGLDAAVLAVVRAAAGWLLPTLSAVPVPVPARRRAPVGCCLRVLHGRRGQRHARPRAPPSAALLHACAAR